MFLTIIIDFYAWYYQLKIKYLNKQINSIQTLLERIQAFVNI